MKRIIKKIIPHFLISWYHFILAYSGAVFYGFPSKKMGVIGVLGTRGKTTIANLIWSCLTAAGYKVGLTGTANIRIGSEESFNKYHMTMPGRFVLQKLLFKMYESGCDFVVVETPSEGVEQWRHKGIDYDIAVLGTLYPEYLETHGWNYERCKKMHLKVFAELSKQPKKIIQGNQLPKVIVVNKDNPESDLFLNFKADRKITYGISSKSDITAKEIKSDNQGTTFKVDSEEYRLNMLGVFNVLNALAAISAASALGVKKEDIKLGLLKLEKVPGRLERIKVGQNFDVFIDYAHDGVSLEALLGVAQKLKKSKSSKIIVLLGAEGGGRDIAKRAVMGKLAAELADIVIVSNVDPYDDDPKKILEDIAKTSEESGKIRGKNLFVIEDRREGIRKSLSLAKKDDIILITGKGAEQSMVIKNQIIRWDDRTVATEELKSLWTLSQK